MAWTLEIRLDWMNSEPVAVVRSRAWSASSPCRSRWFQRLRRSVFAWPLARPAAGLRAVINETSFRRSSEALEHLSARSTASPSLSRCCGRLLDAETGQRGYLLTRRNIYCSRMPKPLAIVFATVDRRNSYYDDPESLALLASLREHASTD